MQKVSNSEKRKVLPLGKEYIQQQVESMNLANQFAQPLELMNAQVEKQLVDMVLCLVKEVVHVEGANQPSNYSRYGEAVCRSAAYFGHPITLHLNPDDVAIIRSAYGEEELDCRNWTLVAEPSLNRGDVQIAAGESGINYRMEERIKSVLNSFCGANRHQGGE